MITAKIIAFVMVSVLNNPSPADSILPMRDHLPAAGFSNLVQVETVYTFDNAAQCSLRLEEIAEANDDDPSVVAYDMPFYCDDVSVLNN